MIHSSSLKHFKISGNNKNGRILKKMSNSCLVSYFDLAMDKPISLNHMACGRVKIPGLIQRDGKIIARIPVAQRDQQVKKKCLGDPGCREKDDFLEKEQSWWLSTC